MNATSGKTEFDIFKNYYTAERSEMFKFMANNSPLQSKDDVASEVLRGSVRNSFRQKKYYYCLEKYTECLRLATFNGREYALALANRSATYFAMNNYKHCLNDIQLSLQADYPIKLKPKILIRKAKCYVKMGNLKKMMETINDCVIHIQNNLQVLKTDQELMKNYIMEIKFFMEIKEDDILGLPADETSSTPEVIQEKNRLNPSVSASIQLKYNKNTGTDYTAARDIQRGEVLFVDKAYAIGFIHDFEIEESLGIFFCDYCWNEAKNCIPCKVCVNVVYCSENCRLSSWSDFHQWECDMIRTKRMSGQHCLALRTLIKAACSGVIFQITDNTKPVKPSKDMDPYLHIYSWYFDFASICSKRPDMIEKSCEITVFMIEFLKKAKFFSHLISTLSCQKDYSALVNFFGGLLFRHNIQLYEKMVTGNCTSSNVSVTENQKELEILFTRSMKFYAFCPVVSGVEYSCTSNTSMYFDGDICIVKANKNIKSGDRILRSGYNLNPTVPFYERTGCLQDDLNINCKCTACEDIKNNMDILDGFLCTKCGTFTVLRSTNLNVMICNNCKEVTPAEVILSKINFALSFTFIENVLLETQGFKKVLQNLDTFKKLMNPYHMLLHNAYEKLLLMCSKRENINEFKVALQSFKTVAENRNGKFDAFEYVMDLKIICKALFAYIQYNKSKLGKLEITEMLNYFSDVVEEAKEISEYTFPPLLRLFASIEVYLLNFRVEHFCLQD